MQDRTQRMVVSSPGRICLFGEHQDYLDLPVIACAISLRIRAEGVSGAAATVRLTLPDISAVDLFTLNSAPAYRSGRDYFKSGLKVLTDCGLTFSRGVDCTVRGNIPISAGVSSSSAMVVAWVRLLGLLSDQQKELSPEECADLAYAAEVTEFKSPGGKMDQYASALGGVLYVSFFPELRFERLSRFPGSIVLGDSREPKDTNAILSRVRNGVGEAVRALVSQRPAFNLQHAAAGEIADDAGVLTPAQRELLSGTLRNRDLTQAARKLLCDGKFDPEIFGRYLTDHHAVLRDILGISTPKIDRMMDAAMAAGALGGKITGSGGGGCMFAYTTSNAGGIAEAIRQAGGEAYVVTVDSGTRVETLAERVQ